MKSRRGGRNGGGVEDNPDVVRDTNVK